MKKGQASVECDGKTQYWCPKHVIPGKYDGLYVTHEPEDHDEQKQNKLCQKLKGSFKDISADVPQEVMKLAITENLKAALLTNSQMTGEHVSVLL